MTVVYLVRDSFTKPWEEIFRYLAYETRLLPGFTLPSPDRGELPRSYSLRAAHSQILFVQQVTGASEESLMLGHSTVVSCGRRLLLEPASDAEATETLALLSGRRHRIFTTLIMSYAGKTVQKQIETVVQWRRLERQEIQNYICAGHYSGRIAGYLPLALPQEFFLKSVRGIPGNLRGVPALLVKNMLNGLRVAKVAVPGI